MTMEKRGVVEPGRTPTDQTPKTKQAADKTATTESLDDDFTKRAADAASNGLKSKNGS